MWKTILTATTPQGTRENTLEMIFCAGLVPLRIRVQWSDTTRPRNLSADVTIVDTHGNAAVNPQMREARQACFSTCSFQPVELDHPEPLWKKLWQTDRCESGIDKSHQLTLREHVGPSNIDDTSGTFHLGQKGVHEIMKADTEVLKCHTSDSFFQINQLLDMN